MLQLAELTPKKGRGERPGSVSRKAWPQKPSKIWPPQTDHPTSEIRRNAMSGTAQPCDACKALALVICGLFTIKTIYIQLERDFDEEERT